MPFTLAHPAAVLPLMRRPFVPAALVAGAMAPDVPYFAGVSATSAGDWYEPFVNATHTHSLSGVPIDLLYAVLLASAWWFVQAPVAKAVGISPQTPDRPKNIQYVGWLIVSALIGIATHLLWDALTDLDFLPSRLLQYASTAFGLVVVGWYLWKHRKPSRGLQRVVVTLLLAVPVLGGLALVHHDYNAYRTTTVVDYSHPTTVDEGNGVTSTTYPETTLKASWGAVAEGVLTGAAKRAGASFAIALLLYAAGWHLTTGWRRLRPSSEGSVSPTPAD
ncbi:DUF4184 family protein [Kribbella sp. NPDC055071]